MFSFSSLMFSSNDILAIAVVASFASGLNVYATVATLGLLSHFNAFQLPPSLDLLNSWPVIIAAALLFGLELFADKIPVFDLLWNALHTFVRVPVAALLSFGAAQNLSPGAQIAASAMGGLIALAAHSGKTAIRAAVTPSPEPLSNTALSFGEDVVAISLTWFATTHPVTASAIVVVCLMLIALAVRYVVRSLGRLFQQSLSYLHPGPTVGHVRRN
jgi:hypothetical protein